MRTAAQQAGGGPKSAVALVATLGMLATLVALGLSSTPASATGVCGPPVTSVIACENTLAGDPRSDWEVTGSGDPALQGFSTAMSVKPGDTVSLKVSATAATYHVDILRFGYYQGNGARKVASLAGPFARTTQPACTTQSATGLVDCGNWSVSLTWTVPAGAVSGIYAAHLVRNDTGGSSLVPFVVRDESSHSDVVVQASDETWQAYNSYGGNSLYQCSVACPPGNPLSYKAAFKVSYNRPFHSAADDGGRSWLTYAELPMISFLEANGYDVSYLSGSDVDRAGSLLLNHETFVSSGHDEYWSAGQRTNVEAARDQGVNLAFFSGNEVFWKTRWESDSSGAGNRTLVAYKDTHFDAPTDPVTWTGTWRDPRFRPGQPENALTGQYFTVNAGTTDIRVPAQYGALRLWRNTAAASLAAGQSLTLGAGLGTLGYEWDVEPDNGFRPAGLFDLSSTTSTAAQTFTDYGSSTADGQTATHHLSLYRAPSGALVFGAGTVQWAWGLDADNPSGGAVDRNMQQATVNLLADMGAQPVTLMAGLTAATASTSRTAPTSAVSAPGAGATVADGSNVNVTGTATASGGSVVAGVEVSTDGGSTWHPATIAKAAAATTWTYSWIAHGNPSTTVRSRAVDDNGNLEATSAGSVVNVTCPCSIWGANVTPGGIDSNDANGVELGVKFTSEVAGSVTGIRFYKSGANTGTHIGNLWSANGTLLGSATFTSETTTGWQRVSFPTAVPIAANTTYVASYHAPNGHYSADSTYLYGQPAPASGAAGITDSAPLHAIRSTASVGNGVYHYGSSSAFPTDTFQATNYWVDVSFTPSSAATGTVNMIAAFVPGADRHEVNVLIDGVVVGGPLGNMESTGATTLAPGRHTMSVTGAGDTDLSHYIVVFWGNCSSDGAIDLPVGGTLSCAAILVHRSVQLPNLRVSDPQVLRPLSGTTQAVFTVSLDGPSFFPVSVHFATADGTASSAAGDYTPTSGTLSFPTGGPTTQTVSVPINGSTSSGVSTSFDLRLSAPSAATLGDAVGTARLISRSGPISVYVSDANVVRSTTSSTSAAFTVQLSAAPLAGEQVTVDVATTDGSAVAGTDYTASGPTPLTFGAGETSKTVQVSVAAKSTATPTRTFGLSVSGPSANAVVADTAGVATLRSSGVAAPPPSLFISDRTVVRATSGSTNAIFTVTLDSASSSNVTVHYGTTDGTATVAAGDYTATSGTLTFSPGQVSKTVAVPTFPTSRRAIDHTFNLVLSAPVGAVLGDASGTGRLINRSGPYTISVADTTVVRSNGVSNTATVTLSLSAPVAVGDTVTLRVRTVDGTATAGTDYTAVPLTTVTFTAGQRTATVAVTVAGAPPGTPVRAFTLTVASPSPDAVIADPAATITLIGP